MQKYIKKTEFTNQAKTPLIIDWLSITSSDEITPIINPDNFNGLIKSLAKCEKDNTIKTLFLKDSGFRSRHFNKVLYVFLYSERIATIECDASNFIFKDRLRIKFENHLFYENRHKEIYDLIVNHFGLKTIKISRLDLAVDGVHFHNHLNKILNPATKQNYKIHKYAKTPQICPYSDTTNQYYEHDYDTFYIGSRGKKSDNSTKTILFGRYYNKTAELNSNNHKEYIKAYFENNNLQGHVYRFELELSASYLANLDNFSIDDIFNDTSLLNLFRTAQKSAFRFHDGSDSRTSRCNEIDFFPLLSRAEIYQKVKQEKSSAITSIKRSIKAMFNELYIGKHSQETNNVRNVIPDIIYSLLERYELNEWYYERVEYWVKECCEYALLHNIELHNSPLYKITNYRDFYFGIN